jgi:hypothetical protein
MAKARKPSARAERRSEQREREKQQKLRIKLALLEPGGSTSNPLVVSSASVIEIQAKSLPCLQCTKAVNILNHDAGTYDGQWLRRVEVQCPNCAHLQIVYFRVLPSSLN